MHFNFLDIVSSLDSIEEKVEYAIKKVNISDQLHSFSCGHARDIQLNRFLLQLCYRLYNRQCCGGSVLNQIRVNKKYKSQVLYCTVCTIKDHKEFGDEK